MSAHLTLHVFDDDLAPDARDRALLDWCLSRGADAFTLSIIETSGGSREFGDALEARLAPYECSVSEVHRVGEGQPGAYWTRPSRLWRLTAASADILWAALDGSLLSYYPSGDSWCEDPKLYRAGELMLGVISHESEGVLRIRPDEQVLLDMAELPYRLQGEWVGY
jgi:hypothetical protein